MTASTSRRCLSVRLALVAGLAVIALAGAWVLRSNPPDGSPFYPPCMLHATTGLHCPGCGATRCLHAMLHGEFEQAVAYNPLAPVLIPAFALLIGASVWQAAGGTRPRVLDLSKWWFLASAAALVAFFVLRNIPHHPFTVLAPHKL
jgi:hypothetical protein